MRAWRTALAQPYDARALAMLRVLVGILVVVSATRWFVYGWIDEYFVQPRFFFKYYGFHWVTVPSAPVLYALFAALIGLGVLFTLGLGFAIVAPLLCLAFVYVQLLDVTNYLNHYYLVALLLGLMATMPLGYAYGLDARRVPVRRRTTLPAWMTWLLRAQVACVYFYAGKAKLSSDWLLHAQPLNVWLSARTDFPLIGAWFDERWVAYVFAWSGFLFDTTIWAFLLWRRTRLVAYGAVLIFHALTMALFPIGLFPLIMVVAALVFFPPDWPRRFGVWRTPPSVSSADAEAPQPISRALFATLALYLTIQLLVPLRMHLYGGNLLWHEQGMRWSWKVMVREKNASIRFLVEDIATGRRTEVSPRHYLDQRQERELAGQADLLLQLAHRIAADWRARGQDVRVFVDARVSLNGRPPAPFVDTTVNLVDEHDGFAMPRFLLPAPTSPPIHLRPVRGIFAR